MIITTEDGSMTIRSEKFGESYHSVFGAQSESEHIFIRSGFDCLHKERIAVLEMGFGTGLNAWLTLLHASDTNQYIDYTALELYPLNESQWTALNFNRSGNEAKLFETLHKVEWGRYLQITNGFNLRKLQMDMTLWSPDHEFDLVFYDAFSPETQPELWSQDIFAKIFNAMSLGGILTTYCAKGMVRRTLQTVGFTVERLPGPKGKREILRAVKKSNHID